MLTDLIEEPKPGDTPAADPAAADRSGARRRDAAAVRRAAAPNRRLVGAAVAGAATSAFARLNQAVQDSVPPPAAPDPGPAVGGNGKTVEDLVKEMLRPMLKEWLDRNLPPMVERYRRTRDRPADPPLTPGAPDFNATAPSPWRFSL